MKIRIGSRGSKLAVAQAKWVGQQIKNKNPSLDIIFQSIKTTGDKDQNSSLSSIGGKGVFVKEIEEALIEKEIDVAVHSLKDVPQNLPAGLELAAFPKREDNREAFISRFGERLNELPRGSTIGTGSPRRLAQLKKKFSNRYRFQPIRGNVETRIQKVKEGEVDAVVLAAAGLIRLDLAEEITEVLETDRMLPAPCQGCLGLEIREGDSQALGICESITDPGSGLTAGAERAFLQGIGGSCLLPIAGMASIQNEKLVIEAKIYDPQSGVVIEGKQSAPLKEYELAGFRLAEQMLHDGASEIILSLS